MNHTICGIDTANSSSICSYIRVSCDQRYYFMAASYFCSDGNPSATLALYSIGALVVIIILISLLGVILSNYLLFSVTNFTDLLGVSHNCLSYVVIPALNCFPDILNYHYSIESNSIDLIMGQVIGANLITFSVIVGTIACLTPFVVQNKMELLREYSYICVLVLVLTYVISDSKITLLECICLILMYVLYVGTLILYSTNDTYRIDEESSLNNKVHDASEETTLLSSNEQVQPSRRTSKIWATLSRFPDLFDLILVFVIPVSKRTLEKMKHHPDSARSRIVTSHVFHVWITFVCVFMLNLVTVKTKFWNALPLALGFSSLKFIPGFLNHQICGILVDVASITNSMIIVTNLTKFIIQLLKNLGLMWEVSQYAMGLIVFSLLNSMNDIIMNVSLAVNFNPSHGIRSCMGSCCLLILIGLGLNGSWLMIDQGLRNGGLWSQALPITLDWELYVSLASLNFVTLFTLGYILLNDWYIDRRLGCLLISFWGLTIFACVWYS